MTLLLLILMGLWAAFLLPPVVRKHTERSADSISSFRQQLHVLERARPGARAAAHVRQLEPIAARAAAGLPSSRAEARRRRRDILFTLSGTVLITLLLAVALGGVAILFQLAADALLGGYMYLLVQMRKTEAERMAKVRYLPAREVPEPALLLRRSASN